LALVKDNYIGIILSIYFQIFLTLCLILKYARLVCGILFDVIHGTIEGYMYMLPFCGTSGESLDYNINRYLTKI